MSRTAAATAATALVLVVLAAPAAAQDSGWPEPAEGPPGTSITIEGNLLRCYGGPGIETSYYGFPERVAFYLHPDALDDAAKTALEDRLAADPNDKSGFEELASWPFTDDASHGWKLTFTLPAGAAVGPHLGVVSFEPRCQNILDGEVLDLDHDNRMVDICVLDADGSCPLPSSGLVIGGEGEDDTGGGAGDTVGETVVGDAGGGDTGAGDDGSGGVPVPLVVAGGAGVVAGAGVLLSRRGRVPSVPTAPSAPTGPSAPPLVDAYGEPLTVHDGVSYQGGRAGQVWWNGDWIDPERARSEIARQHDAIRLRAEQDRTVRDATRDQFDDWLDRRGELDRIEDASREMRARARDDAIRRQEALDALDDARRELQRRREEMWSGEARAHERWGRLMGAGESGAEATAWVADRSIDTLAAVTGPAGKGIKDVYTISKRVGKGVGTAHAYGGAHHVVEGVAEGLTDVAFGRMFDTLGKQKRIFGIDHVPRPKGPSLADLDWRALRGQVSSDPIAGRWGPSVRDVVSRELQRGTQSATRSYTRSTLIRDPFKNLAADAAHWMGWPR